MLTVNKEVLYCFWFLINTLFWKVIIMKMMLSRNIPLIQRTRPNNRTVFHLLMKSAITRTIVCFAYLQKYSMNYVFTSFCVGTTYIKCWVSQFGKWQKDLFYTQTKAFLSIKYQSKSTIHWINTKRIKSADILNSSYCLY
jgi:hypothetical protein